jgi:hypothetical protein
LLPGPLHRLTRLKDDPASHWLTSIDHAIVTVKGWGAWALYAAFIRGVFAAFYYVISTASGDYNLAQSVGMGWRRVLSIPGLLTAGLAAFLLVPMRRAVIRLRASATAKMAREAAMAQAAAVDDFTALEAEPDGRLVSLVGWVRGHGYLYHPVAGDRAVGLTLRCQDGVPFVMETMHNFDLLDEAGNTALVVTADARLLGDANVQLSRASPDDRQLLVSLDLPASAVPTDWNAFVVRDGDPVLVVGTKTTIQDMTELQHGRSPNRTAVAATKARPLLLFPLDAERREV